MVALQRMFEYTEAKFNFNLTHSICSLMRLSLKRKDTEWNKHVYGFSFRVNDKRHVKSDYGQLAQFPTRPIVFTNSPIFLPTRPKSTRQNL